jgi:small subunit ribosomal protein S17
MASERARKRTVVGTVVSDKMDKTISVREDRLVKHPMYGKYVRRASIYKAHDENNEAHEGDQVEILETRPLSKTKHWRLARVVRKAGARHVDADEADRADITPARRQETASEEASS